MIDSGPVQEHAGVSAPSGPTAGRASGSAGTGRANENGDIRMGIGKNRRIVLAARPVGEPRDSDFRLEETGIPEPGPGQLLLRTIWLSLDPYMRGRMNEGRSYAPPVGLGEVMVGGTVSEVLASNLPDFAPG